MNRPTPPQKETPQDAAARVARTFFRIGPDKASQKLAVRQSLLGAVECAVLIPALFYWRFGEVGALGWGTTIFFVAYCLLMSVGLYFQPLKEYHTPVRLLGDWIDWVGAFWLVSCAFGPFLGWVVTSVFPLTVSSWRWLYILRVILAAGLPLLTALPLTRYVRGKAAWVALPLLAVITMLPVWSAVNASRDLAEGPIVRQVLSGDYSELYLQHTGQSLGIIK